MLAALMVSSGVLACDLEDSHEESSVADQGFEFHTALHEGCCDPKGAPPPRSHCRFACCGFCVTPTSPIVEPARASRVRKEIVVVAFTSLRLVPPKRPPIA